MLPRHSGGVDFTFQDLVLVAMILRGLPFNFASMMVQHIVSCIRQLKKCLPYGAYLTRLLHFEIPLEDEAFVILKDSIDSDNLKSSHLSLVDGQFVRVTREVPIPHSSSANP